MESGGVLAVEDSQARGAFEKSGCGQPGSSPADNQRGQRCAPGIHILLEKNLDQPRQFVNSMWRGHIDGIGRLQVRQRSPLATGALQYGPEVAQRGITFDSGHWQRHSFQAAVVLLEYPLGAITRTDKRA